MWRLGALILLLPFAALAEKPALDGLFPSGVARGTTNSGTLFGKFDPWPPRIWFSGEGISFGFETNKGKFTVAVSPDAEPGPRLVRLFNDDGASDAAFFVVEEGAALIETEPNNHFRKAQAITNLPVVLSGRLERNGDVDSYAIEMKAGEWLDARLESYVMMAKLDPVLRLLDTNGFQLGWNHDFGSLDPRLVWRSPKDQTVVVQVFGFLYPANNDIQLSGGASGFYRAHLSVSSACPLPMPAAERNEIACGETAEGTICPGGNVDTFRVHLKKDQWVEARVLAYAIGSPLDPWVAVRDADGRELARNDDAEGTRDARLEWRVPADGEYAFAVGSVTSAGREDFRYRLELRELAPDFVPEAPEQALALTAGATNLVKVKIQRQRGFTNQLELRIAGLPEGMAATATTDGQAGEVGIPLVAATNAPAWAGPVRLLLRDPASGAEKVASFPLVSRTENNGVPGGYSKLLIESVEELWLTVRAAAEK